MDHTYLGSNIRIFAAEWNSTDTYYSAADLLRASFDEKGSGKHPKALYLNGSEVGVVTAEAKDEKKQKELWQGSLLFAGIKEGDTALTNWKKFHIRVYHLCDESDLFSHPLKQ